MAKRFNDSQKVGDILKNFVADTPFEQGINQVLVEETWSEIMGNGIKNYTTNVTLKKSKLYISLSSSVVREELSYGKEKIIKMLNEALGKEIITELILR